jgi:hypothetical protein
MSTKIYIGQRAIRSNVFEVADLMRAVLEPMFFDHFDKAVDLAEASIGETWASVFHLAPDFCRQNPDWNEPIGPSQVGPYGGLVWDLMVALNDWPLWAWSPVDFAYSVSFIPDGRGAVRRPPLILLYAEFGGDEYRGALETAGIVEEFAYWNNVDKPDYVTTAQWRQRKLAWDKLNVPSEDGLKLEHPSKVQTVYGRPIRKDPSLLGGDN